MEIVMETDDIMDHPLFSDVPADLSEGHSGFMALAHLSSSSEEEETRPKSVQSRIRKTITKPEKRLKQNPFDKKMKELNFVTRNWRPLKNNR